MNNNNSEEVLIGVIEITDKNKESLTKLAIEMTRRMCSLCKRYEIPYCRCLKCARDICEGCTGKKEVPRICVECFK